MNEKVAFWRGTEHNAYYRTNENGEPVYRRVVIYHCSNCKRQTVIQENYCPSCGFKMKGKYKI